MNTTTNLRPASSMSDDMQSMADRAATKTQQAIDTTRVATDDALDALSGGVVKLSKEAPDAIARITAQVEELTRRSLERARETSAQVRDAVNEASDRTVARIKDEPVKAVLIAAATGAAVAALISLLSNRSRY